MGSLLINEENAKAIIRQEQCPKCAGDGRDKEGKNLSVYEDNSAHCWSANCDYNVSNVEAAGHEKAEPVKVDPRLIKGTVEVLKDRGIAFDTCTKYNVQVGSYTGEMSKQDVVREPVIIYPIYERGIIVRQKIRSRNDKSKQKQIGGAKSEALFGMNCFTPTDRIGITITEGEYDAMAIFQATGYPAVSGMRGGKGAVKDILANLDWLMQWKHVNLAFDMDEAGRASIEACVSIFEPGKVRIVNFPLKDANDMVLAGRSDEIKKCLWDASIYKPQTLVSVEDIWDSVLEKPEMGAPWPFPSMTEITYGLMWGTVSLLAAAKGIGKTQLLQEIVIFLLTNKVHVGLFFLEQTPADTMRRFVGGLINKRLHLPGSEWNEDEVKVTLDTTKDKIVLCDKSSGRLTLDTVLINIRYAHACYGTRFFVVDNLKKLAACPMIEGQRVPRVQFMGEVMTQLSNLATELNVSMIVVQHLNSDKPKVNVSITPGMSNDLESMSEGLSYESGRMPGMLNIYGAGDITDLVDNVMVLSRNRVSSDMVVKCTTTVKFLQTRLDGTKDGAKFKLYYSPATGRMTEEMPDDLQAMIDAKAEQAKSDAKVLT